MSLTAQQCRFCLRVRYFYHPENFQSEWMKDLPKDVRDSIRSYQPVVCESAVCGKKSTASLEASPETANLELCGKIVMVLREHIRPFPNQPRKYFDKLKLNELASSIREVGQLVPILIKEIEQEKDSPYRFELIDGQRRWHAAEIAEIQKMKAIVVSVKDEDEQFTMSVISNFGRVDHSPVEAATAIKRFIDQGKTVAQVANTFARSQPWVYQHLKLLSLEQDVLNLMSPEVPEAKRLIFSTALLLADLPPTQQKKIAKKVAGDQMKYFKAKTVIRQEAEKIGVVVGDPNRSPNKDYNILWSLLSKLQRELEIHLGMPQSYFDRMFASRTDDNRREVVDKVRDRIAELKMLNDAIEKTKKD